MRNFIVFVTIFLCSISFIYAQGVFYPEQHELVILKNQWLNSNNASGLSINDIPVHGNTELGYQDFGGNYHRAQEGNRLNGLRFISERYDKMSKNWLVWGSFEFQMKTETDRCWSNVFNTYNSSPYNFGDSIKGKYDTQSFDLHAKFSRKIANRWAIGAGVDYFAGDMSRLRDARTRSFIVNYAVIPSVSYRLSTHHTLGLTMGIRFEKEKMPGISNVQSDPIINYYNFLGNENTSAVLDGYNGFDRQFINMIYSAGLQHSYSNEHIEWFSNIEFVSRNQQIFGSEHESPGSYAEKKYSIKTEASIKSDNSLLNISLKGFLNKGTANEFLQQSVEVRDTTNGSVSKSWETLYIYQDRYTTDSYSADMSISLRDLLNKGTDYSWVAAVDAQFTGFSNKYYLPYSVFESQRLHLGASYGIRVLNKNGHRVNVNAKTGFGFGLYNKLQLNPIASAIPTNGSSMFEKATHKIATEILIPDLDYYRQNVYDYRIDVRYSFPLKMKNSKLSGFAKAFYANQLSVGRGSWMLLGISIGIISF
ncbi:MAG: DUF6850 family outer membrane beta-barrel protein [Paludibacter sp.]